MNKAKAIISREHKYLLGNYGRPDDFVPVRGKGSYLYDIHGKAYLDFVDGIAVNVLGYANPALMKAAADQMKKFPHVSNLYHTGLDAEVAEMLVTRTCADRAFFCNSGTEANEAAIKFVRRWAARNHSRKKFDIITFTNAFHGRTYGALSATPQKKYQEDFGPMLGGFKYVSYNDSRALEKAVNSNTAAIMLEFIQGEGGGDSVTPAFVAKILKLCKRHKALIIADEIQSGLTRTGTFMTHQDFNIKPDIITLAKPIGGGLPLGAVLMSQAVADHIKPGDHGTTFGGNPVALSVAKVVIAKMADKSFQASVRRKGELLRKLLCNVKSPLITDIRGRGLWNCVVVREKSVDIINALRKNGLLTVRGGAEGIRFLPPLTVSESEIRKAVGIFAKTLRAF